MTSALSKEPRRFAPLGTGHDKEIKRWPKLNGIVFDVDGTLWLVLYFLLVWIFGFEKHNSIQVLVVDTLDDETGKDIFDLQSSSQRTDGALKPVLQQQHLSVHLVLKQNNTSNVSPSLSAPQNYMFVQMREALGITKGVDILDHCHSLPPVEQELALEKIRTIERTAMLTQVAQPGLVQLMEYLESRNIPKGICTRNFETPVNHLLTTFLAGRVFAPIVTREFKPPKPNPAGILHIARTWGFVKEDGTGDAGALIMVGDSIDDMTAGYKAGAATVLLVNEANAHLATHQHTDLCISRLDELINILEEGFAGHIAQGDEESDLKGRAEDVLREGVGETK
ncbi:uncharacterized protein BP5553_05284 [Venustampulla echinocandica]|uniref:HAD-like protein n=1 Tax=Venustampulla echinocandica TaxID=2656787 RepID=A0A370TQN9_9HELO|nr:uncharacterized protein BP5553_05284 [Venustampulla echinocandica]RDL37851.1 hypothetical protein BP5553_05284 [Venustampulla echinocandica]